MACSTLFAPAVLRSTPTQTAACLPTADGQTPVLESTVSDFDGIVTGKRLCVDDAGEMT